jgi:phosphate ABC transporter phosphate-binding protein
MLVQSAPSALADVFVPISGAGSTWSQNAVDQWRRNVAQYGLTVNFQGTGSSDGRNQFRNGTVDFAVSEIPYGLKDSGVIDQPPPRGYAYMPIVAGGTSFMYNLTIGGKRVTNLRLSGPVLAKIFTGVITNWSDPAIAADNPGLTLPARKVVPVVRSDGSGSSAQFTTWMSKQHSALWNSYCGKAGRATPCGQTSNYPVLPGSGFTAQSGSLGVAGYVAQPQNAGTITYVEYSYALNSGFPVAKLLNKAGYYAEPTAQNVAVGLLGAKIDNRPGPTYLTQILDGVFNNPDPRTYPMSSYSYMIVPTKVESNFSLAKGKSVSSFANYFLCQGQQDAGVLGYSPLPMNLVQAGMAQVKKVPGANTAAIDIRKCNNPTFSSDGRNTLALTAPQPSPCDKIGVTQCAKGTGGAAKQPTAVSAKAKAPSAAGQAPGAGTPAGVSTALPGVPTAGAPNPASSVPQTIDPLTGQVVALGATDAASGGPVSAQPVALMYRSNKALWYGVLAVMLLLLVILGPAVVVRTLKRPDAGVTRP